MRLLGVVLVSAATVLLAAGLFLLTAGEAAVVTGLIVLSWAVIAGLAGVGLIYRKKRASA